MPHSSRAPAVQNGCSRFLIAQARTTDLSKTIRVHGRTATPSPPTAVSCHQPLPTPTSPPRPVQAQYGRSARAAALPGGASAPAPQCRAAPSCRKGRIRAANERVAFRALRRRLGLPAPAALPDAPTVAIRAAVGSAPPPPPRCPPRNRLRPGAARRRSRRRRRRSSRCVPFPPLSPRGAGARPAAERRSRGHVSASSPVGPGPGRRSPALSARPSPPRPPPRPRPSAAR